jgi:hypothetical protein
MTTDNCSTDDVVTITLATRPARPLQVTATVGDPSLGGNTLLTGSTRIMWHAQGDVAAYRVTFFDLSTGQAIWPFTAEPDGRDSRGPFLRVTADGVAREFSRTGPSEIKYDVAVDDARDDVDPLDPTIIIRPARALS